MLQADQEPLNDHMQFGTASAQHAAPSKTHSTIEYLASSTAPTLHNNLPILKYRTGKFGMSRSDSIDDRWHVHKLAEAKARCVARVST